MATVGERLRNAREANKLSVYQVAEATKIRTDHIRALEAGEWDVFAAKVYIRGFVRTYAALLKLDEAETLAALEAELAQAGKFREPPPFRPEQRGALDTLMLQVSRVKWQFVLPFVVAGVVGLGGFIGYRLWQKHCAKDPAGGLKPGVYQPSPKDSGETLPLPPVAPERR
jgi:cytoskeletal protein RodZ